MSKCCNIFEKDLSYVFTTYNPPFTNLKELCWDGHKIISYNDFVLEAHYYRDYLILKGKLLPRETIDWYIPLDQAWSLTMSKSYPVQTFWLDANLRKIDKPLPKWTPMTGITEQEWHFNRWKPEEDAIAFGDQWSQWLISNGQWYN